MKGLLVELRDGEQGVTLVLVTLLVFVMLAFAALVVDLGYQEAQRRQAQSAVDSAVLAAGVTIFTSNGDLQAAIDDVLTFSDGNTKWSLPGASWLSCTDPDALQWTAADLGLSPATQCISFDGGFGEIRALLPTFQLDSFFGKIVGIDTLPVWAEAQAEIGLPFGTSTPPFVVLADAMAGDEVCLRTSSSGQDMPGQWIGNGVGGGAANQPTQPLASEPDYVPDPCDELPSTSQFFGTLNPYFYNDVDPSSNPDTACRSFGSNSIDFTIADGIDHILSSFEPDYPPGSDVRVEGVGCPQGPPSEFPNTMDLQTGFTAQKLRCGLLSSGGGTCSAGPDSPDNLTVKPRFQRGFFSAGPTRAFAGEDMENRPPWTFFRSDLQSVLVPGSCKAVDSGIGSTGWDYYDLKEGFLDCLTDWGSGNFTTTLFSTDLLVSGRFAFIPQLAEGSLSSSPVHFNSFVPIFFHQLYQSGNRQGSPPAECFSQAEGATGNSGWYWHQAGQDFDCGRNNQNVDRVAAIVIDCGMLPAPTCTPDSTSAPGGDPVLEVRLTR